MQHLTGTHGNQQRVSWPGIVTETQIYHVQRFIIMWHQPLSQSNSVSNSNSNRIGAYIQDIHQL
ncbi:hypothetical protein Gotur_013978 [Gossypium turneri]